MFLFATYWTKMTFSLSLCLLVVATVAQGRIPRVGEIAIKQSLVGGNLIQFELSDGRVYLDAKVSEDHALLSCTMNRDPVLIKSIVKDHDADVLHIGQFAVDDMKQHCHKVSIKKKYEATRTKDGSSNDSIFNTTEPFSPEETGDPAGPLGSFAIFPGTKWCGLSNKADNYDDLGENNVTDACCRTHDHCPYFIDHFENKYNFENPYPWTLSHCDCDEKLYDCLKAANTTASNEVGKLFFGLLNVKCFTFEYGQYCAQRHWSKLWCEKEAYGEKAVTKTFPHTWSENIIG